MRRLGKDEKSGLVKKVSFFYVRLSRFQVILLDLNFMNSEEYSADLQEKINEYKTKMQQIAQDKNCLPLRYFEQVETLIRTQILQSYTHTDTQSILQQALLSWRNELYSRNLIAISKWCNELLSQSTSSVDKKICRQVKSFAIYRQEMVTTVEILRKKIEPYLTCELSIAIQDALFQKVFEHTGQLHTYAISQMQDNLKMLQIQNKALAVECRQAKRRTNKEDNDLQRTISELKQKLNLAQIKYSLLQQNNEELRKELLLCQETKEQSISKLTQELNLEITLLRTKLDEGYEQKRQAIKRSTFLEMQLQKEQLLHQQTTLHYQELIASYHDKQQELKQEIIEASRVSEKQIDQFKLLSTRRIQDWQQTANDLEEQLEKTQKDLKLKESQALTLKQTLTSLKQSSKSQIEELSKRIMQLEYRNRVLEQKQTECQQLKLRIQKLENEIKKVQRDRDQLNDLCKQTEKQLLIVEQKNQYLRDDLGKQQQKMKNLIQLQNQKENITKNKGMIDNFSQTEQDIYRQKLKAALQIISQLQIDCQKWQKHARRSYF